MTQYRIMVLPPEHYSWCLVLSSKTEDYRWIWQHSVALVQQIWAGRSDWKEHPETLEFLRVELTSVTEPSSMQENYSAAPDRVYYRLTEEGAKADQEFWSNPLFTLYPEIGPSHMKRPD
jgi:hypothetical protein